MTAAALRQRDHAARPDAPPDGDRPAMAIEENHVDREAHAEGVDRAAARKEKRPAVRRLAPPGEPSEPRPPRLRDDNPHSKKSRPRATLTPHRRRSSVGQSTALVKRGSWVRIPPSAWLCRAKSRLLLLSFEGTRVQHAYKSDPAHVERDRSTKGPQRFRALHVWAEKPVVEPSATAEGTSGGTKSSRCLSNSVGVLPTPTRRLRVSSTRSTPQCGLGTSF